MKLPHLLPLLAALIFPGGSAFAQTFTSTTPYVCQAEFTSGYPVTDPSTFHCQGIPYPNYINPVLQSFTLGGKTLVTGSGINWVDNAWVPFTVTLNNETDQNCPLDPHPNSTEPARTCGSFAFTAYPIDTNGVTHMMNFQGNWVNHHPASGLIGRWNYPEYTYSQTTVN